MRAASPLVGLFALALAAACSSTDGAGSSGATPGDAGDPADGQAEGGVPAPADGGADGSTGPLRGALTVLTLNLHCLKTDGTAFASNDARFAAIAQTVRDENVDVILAQELCVSATENAKTMLTSALDRATGASWASEIAFAHRAWEGTPDEADEDVGIFSRTALTAARELVHRAQSPLRRVSLGVTVASPLQTAGGAPLPVRLHTVHLDHLDAVARPAQAREVASMAMLDGDDDKLGLDMGPEGVSLPLIVGGDFNARSDAAAVAALVDFGFVESTGSAGTTRIDHVFSHRSAPLSVAMTKEVFLGAAAVSDHPGVIVRFEAAAPKPVHLTRISAAGVSAEPLTVRGDRAPLSWQLGWPAFNRRAPSAPAASLVTSELDAQPFLYKFLRSDTVWQTGANVAGNGQRDNATTPAFP